MVSKHCEQIQWIRSLSVPKLSDFARAFYASNVSEAFKQIQVFQSVGIPLVLIDDEPASKPFKDLILKLSDYEWFDSALIHQQYNRLQAEKNPKHSQISLSQVYTKTWVDSSQLWAEQHHQDSGYNPWEAKAFFTDYQSEGRGRRGRAWCAPFGACLMVTLSVVLPKSCLKQSLSPWLSVSLTNRLATLTQLPIKVKWPNDLLLEGGKLAGCLIQSMPARLGGDSFGEGDWLCLLIGLGLNLRGGNGTEVGQPVVGIWDNMVVPIPKNLLAAHLVEVLLEALSMSVVSEHEDEMKSLWQTYDAFNNKKVKLELPNSQIVQGLNQGLDEDGQLVVLFDSGKSESFCVGDISMRGF